MSVSDPFRKQELIRIRRQEEIAAAKAGQVDVAPQVYEKEDETPAKPVVKKAAAKKAAAKKAAAPAPEVEEKPEEPTPEEPEETPEEENNSEEPSDD